jgi:hypothetical protein
MVLHAEKNANRQNAKHNAFRRRTDIDITATTFRAARQGRPTLDHRNQWGGA